MDVDTPIARFAIVLGLGFFFGLAFEEFYSRAQRARPGGIRSFPLLALTGALLFRLDPVRCLPFSAGLLVLGAWLACYYWRHTDDPGAEDLPKGSLMVPICNVLAYLLGPVALSQPPWVAVGATVAAVLLMTARDRLHGLARRIEPAEIVTAGKFLILTGLVLPLLPDQPVTALTDITPHQVWLAVLAVCTVSYASYLLQRYWAPPGAGVWVALLGGFYSSTATTVVLARRARAEPATLMQAHAGIVLATAVMYLRLLAIIFVFDRDLAIGLAPWLTGLSACGLIVALVLYRVAGARVAGTLTSQSQGNPLELGAAAIFAVLFVAISLASTWAKSHFGASGVYLLAGIVGVTDIDPFVLSLAQQGATDMPRMVAVIAILIAISSNNLLKAAYSVAFAGARESLVPASALVGLAAAGGAVAAWLAVVAR